MKPADAEDAYKYDIFGNLNSEKKVVLPQSSSESLDQMKSEQRMLEEKLKKISQMEERIKA